MANFLRTTGIIHEIEELIVNAKVKLIILSPYIRMADIIIERLKGKENKNIEIIFVYGKKELNTNELKKIKSLSNIQLFFNKNLHGKFYANEDNAIITSMNLYEFSERNNREFGISVNKKIDSKIFQESMEEVDSIIKNATLVFTNKIANTNNEIIIPPINFDFLQYLYEQLKISYPSQTFIIGNGKIHSNKFTNENVGLEIIPNENNIRVNLIMTHKEYKSRKDAFKYLYNLKEQIESAFPERIISWGNQMNRVKLDLQKKHNPLFFNSNKKILETTMELIEISIKEISNKIP